MRECPVCGASNGPTDGFCDNCGSYLGWSDTPTAPATPTPPPQSTATTPAAATPAVTTPADGPPASGTPAETTVPPPATLQPAAPQASAPKASPPPGSPPPDSPQPVLPAKAVAPRPVVRPVPVDDDDAGAPCPSCGTPNPPDRRFCRRCATPLTPRTTTPPLPWWRTIWPLRRRTRAGSGRTTRFLVILAVVLALCAGGFLLLPAGRSLIEDTRDKLGKSKAVTPVRMEASAEVPGHPVGDATDGLSNRYWGAPGPGASVTYTFAKPFRLVAVIVTNGASTSPEDYAREGRALQIDMEVTTSHGRKVVKKLTLSDKPGPQTFPTGISDATTIRLTLDAPAGLDGVRHLALAELEFFQRS
ncbi:zinc ribbon domain-containing protein [Streptomyces sp. CB01881]|uniref:NADase-type glycan-binding domain-containing protein n=1 Tax=Streptomyces sp. CB01881 TaxID=2078691 RepID=UPI0011E0671D|nr:zinc-ribbon domain-containing protein [Streptomyces sp. CB01881]TYC66298.1 zinc ribbon domain-containing protein [Streptomyces sp. CB01881]